MARHGVPLPLDHGTDATMSADLGTESQSGRVS